MQREYNNEEEVSKRKVVSKGEEQTGWCFDEECKDLSRKFRVLMNEFDKLNALF